jgi:transcriptional regulator with XRE-family HTH domain
VLYIAHHNKRGRRNKQMSIGERLRDLRGSKSVTEVAEALGIAQSTLSMYENDERIPRDIIKIKIAKYYNQTIESIFFADE